MLDLEASVAEEVYRRKDEVDSSRREYRFWWIPGRRERANKGPQGVRQIVGIERKFPTSANRRASRDRKGAKWTDPVRMELDS